MKTKWITILIFCAWSMVLIMLLMKSYVKYGFSFVSWLAVTLVLTFAMCISAVIEDRMIKKAEIREDVKMSHGEKASGKDTRN